MDFIVQLNVNSITSLQYFEFSNFDEMLDSHNLYELIYVDSGELNIVSEHYKGKLLKNQMIIHAPNVRHKLSTVENHSSHVIVIGFECKTTQLEPFYIPVNVIPAQQNVLAQLVREGRNIFLPPYDVPSQIHMKKRDGFAFGADQLIKNLLEYFLILMIRNYDFVNKRKPLSEQNNIILETHITDPIISDVCDYINNNLTHKFTLHELCLIFGNNKTTLSKLFKQQTGYTIIEYIQKTKIERAKNMLQSGLSATNIAANLKFSSIHSFSKLFKQCEGISPTEYVKNFNLSLIN